MSSDLSALSTESDDNDDDEDDEILQNLKCECCGRGDDADKMLLCDGEGCNKGYHIYCIFPPLDEIPEDDWFCDQCELIRNTPFSTLPEGKRRHWVQSGLDLTRDV